MRRVSGIDLRQTRHSWSMMQGVFEINLGQTRYQPGLRIMYDVLEIVLGWLRIVLSGRRRFQAAVSWGVWVVAVRVAVNRWRFP